MILWPPAQVPYVLSKESIFRLKLPMWPMFYLLPLWMLSNLAAAEIRINELSEFSGPGDGCPYATEGWVELANIGESEVDLSGAVLCGEAACGNAAATYVFPTGAALPAASRGVLCRDGKFSFSVGGLQPTVVTLEDSQANVLATTGEMLGCTETTSIMSCTDRIFSEFAREQLVSYGVYDSEGAYGFLYPQTPGRGNVLSCPGNTEECTYTPEHIWNVTCADPYAEEFLGSEALCQAACSNDDECNFFWVNENGKCSRFKSCQDTRQVIWSFDGKETRTTTWKKLTSMLEQSEQVCSAPFTCAGNPTVTTATTSSATRSETGNSAGNAAYGIANGFHMPIVLVAGYTGFCAMMG